MEKFYNENKQQFKISVDELCSKMYCVAFTEGSFYRGKVVEIPQFTDSRQRATVFLIDFGYTVHVEFTHLYYCYEKLYEVPHFAVRACLSQIKPCDSDIWTGNVIQRFNELVYEKVLLCILESVDPINKVVYISIADVDKYSQVYDIGDTLVIESLAIPLTSKRKMTKTQKQPIKEYSYLYPTSEAIEQCEAPSNAKIFEHLYQSRAAFSLWGCYYKINEKN